MSVSILTASCESATISLTNGGANSNAAYLKNRDLRVLGLSVAAGTSTVSIEMNFSSSYASDYIVLGNLTSSANVGINTYTWNGASYDPDAIVAAATYTNTNKAIDTSDNSVTKYKIEFTRGSSGTLALSCVFIGDIYSFAYPYKYGNNRQTFIRGEKIIDVAGYPRSFIYSTTKKFRWDVVFQMTKTNLGNLETALVNCAYDKKPFFITDTNIDSTWRMVRMDDAMLNARQPAVDFYEIDFRATQI